MSYASVDKAIADAVCAALESADIRCWIAPRDVERASAKLPQRTYPQLLNAVRPPLGVPGVLPPSANNGIPAANIAASRSRSKRSRLIAAAASIAIALAVTAIAWVSSRTIADKSRRPAAIVAILEKFIVVLPFADMNETHDQEYFAEGMAEEVSELLAKLHSLRVIGRSSAFHFKGRAQDPQTVGRDLGAACVVQGSARKSGDRLRIMAQLIQTPEGTQVWAETYDDSFGDVLNVQDRI